MLQPLQNISQYPKPQNPKTPKPHEAHILRPGKRVGWIDAQDKKQIRYAAEFLFALDSMKTPQIGRRLCKRCSLDNDVLEISREVGDLGDLLVEGLLVRGS